MLHKRVLQNDLQVMEQHSFIPYLILFENVPFFVSRSPLLIEKSAYYGALKNHQIK